MIISASPRIACHSNAANILDYMYWMTGLISENHSICSAAPVPLQYVPAKQVLHPMEAAEANLSHVDVQVYLFHELLKPWTSVDVVYECCS